MTTRAFTLIELLATIAIIALLIGLLMPALGRARASGQQLVCSSNARQLQMANTSFALDNNERYAPGAKDFVANLSRWHGSRTNTSSAFTPNGSPLYDYLGESDGTSQAVRECPTFERVITVNEAKAVFKRQVDNLEELARFITAYVASVVLDDVRVLESRAFVEAIDLDHLVFDPEEWRRLWDSGADSEQNWSWSFDPRVMRTFRRALREM